MLEALSALLAHDIRARVLSEALVLEGSDAIPEDLVRARAFVEGPLRLVVKRRVGSPIASMLVETLAPIFVRAGGADARAPAPEELTLIGMEEDSAGDDTAHHSRSHLEQLRERIRSSVAPKAGATDERLTERPSGVVPGSRGEGARRSHSGVDLIDQRVPPTVLVCCGLVRRMRREGFVDNLGDWVLVGSVRSSEDDPSWSYHTNAGVRAYRPAASAAPVVDPEHVVLPVRKARGGPFAKTLLIGRASSNDIQLEDPSVSKLHARITVSDGGALLLSDAESRNGTFLNDRRIGTSAHPIEDGDKLEFGERAFRLFETARLYDALRAQAS